MRSRLSGPMRIAFHPAPNAEPAPVDPLPAPLVGLTTYAEDSLAVGYVALTAARVTDLLNEYENIEFVDAYLQSLEDHHGLAFRTIAVARNEILAVGVAGPRGDPARRTRTRPIPVQLRIGPYDIRGNLHVLPGTDPMSSFRRRGSMVPLTEATVEWDAPDGHHVARWGTVVVNRLLTEWIAPATRDVRPPEVQLVPDLNETSMAKDFTPRLQAE